MGRALDAPGDGALVAAIGRRDEAALAEAYRRHGGAVWAVARRLSRTAGAAEAVCEAVFTELWSRPGDHDPAGGSLRATLVARARTRAIGTTRADAGAAAGAGVAGGNGPAPSSPPVPPVPPPPGGEARRAVEQLDAPERDVLLLAYVGGHTCRETARRLGVPEDEVKRRVRRGLLRLREAFQAQEVAP